MYDTLYELHEYLVQFEPRYNEIKILGLDTSVDVLYERYIKRNRPGETLTKEYL